MNWETIVWCIVIPIVVLLPILAVISDGKYLKIYSLILAGIISLPMTIILPVYTVSNVLKIYSISNSNSTKEVGIIDHIYYGKGISFVINFRLEGKDKIYRKNYIGTVKDNNTITVMFNEKRNFYIIQEYINREYITNVFLFLLTGIFILILWYCFINIRYRNY